METIVVIPGIIINYIDYDCKPVHSGIVTVSIVRASTIALGYHTTTMAKHEELPKKAWLDELRLVERLLKYSNS